MDYYITIMVIVKKEGVILEPTKLEFENQAVLNPASSTAGKHPAHVL